MCAQAFVCPGTALKSENNFQGSFFVFYAVSPRDITKVLRLVVSALIFLDILLALKYAYFTS